MFLDYLDCISELLAVLVSLSVCLFYYIDRKAKSLVYAALFFLFGLLSSYYWTAYYLLMGTSPDAYNEFYYFGWNVAYLILAILLIQFKTMDELFYFPPIMLIPIPINIWQLFLYLPYGDLMINLYQVGMMSVVMILALQGIIWHFKHKNEQKIFPSVHLAAFFIGVCSFASWTASCFDDPIGALYYPFTIIVSIAYVYLAWGTVKSSKNMAEAEDMPEGALKYETYLKIAYMAGLLFCCLGGIILATWMKGLMLSQDFLSQGDGMDRIITVVLFITSLFLAGFAVAIISTVYLLRKMAENTALRNATKLAEHSNEAKSEFLANMSHEIRTPINAMLGMNEIIHRESVAAKSALPDNREAIKSVFTDISRYSGDIENAGHSLLSIINDILDFSKIESGKLELVTAPYKLSSVLKDVSNMIIFKANSRNLEFHAEVDENIPENLYGDAVRVRQIVTNLLNNAVKYTDKGSVTMTVCCEPVRNWEADSIINLKVAVKDTGIGIKPEDKEKLFKKFERMDLERNSGVEGTGLGLAITDSLLELMGGSIDVESVYGEGSTFAVTIPQSVVSKEPIGDFNKTYEKNMEEMTVQRESFIAPGAHILIVDDTAMNITVAVGLLKNTRIKIDSAYGGAEAVELCHMTAYDVILLDQRMPGMDGTEALKRIREDKDGKNLNTPVICLTADAVGGAKERYLAQGFTDYLSKPVNGASLEGSLLQYLPKDKIHFTKKAGYVPVVAEPEPENTTDKELLKGLKDAGIDTGTGLRYCDNDMELYKTLLADFHNSASQKISAIQSYYDVGNWNDYGTMVHALKSTSKTIGALKLSNIAAGMEAAAEDKKADIIRSGNIAMISYYTAVHEAVGQLVTQGQGGEYDVESSSDEDEVLEFLPEEK